MAVPADAIRFDARAVLDAVVCGVTVQDGAGTILFANSAARRILGLGLGVWDALSSNRPYRDGWPEARVREHLAAGAGAHFDPEVVTAFLALEWPARGDTNVEA